MEIEKQLMDISGNMPPKISAVEKLLKQITYTQRDLRKTNSNITVGEHL